MGHGMLKDVSGRLVETFAENLAAMLEGKEPADAGAPARPTLEQERAAEPTATGAGGDADALDLGSLGGQFVADQLRDPRRLAAALVLVASLFFILGRRAARR